MKLPAPKSIAIAFRALLCLLLLAAGGGVFVALKSAAPELETTDPQDRAIRIHVLETRQVSLPRQWRGFGTTVAKHTVEIPSRVGATVVSIPDEIEVGRVVTAGQVLAQLDPGDFQREADTSRAQLAEAEATIAQLDVDLHRWTEQLALEEQDIRLAEEELGRQQGFFDNGRASQQDLDRARRSLLNAQRAAVATHQSIDAVTPRRLALEAQRDGVHTRLAIAEENVVRCTIRSTLDGVIEALDVEEGEHVTAGERIARVTDPRLIEVPVMLPGSARNDIEVGNTVSISTRSLPHDCEPWQSQVARIAIQNDPDTRTFTAYALLDQTQTALSQIAAGGGVQRIPVGAFVSTTLLSNDTRPRWVVPARSIREGRIRLVEDGRVTSRSVNILYEYEGAVDGFGVPDTQWAVIDATDPPLRGGELLIVSASVSVLDGQHVVAVLPKPSPPAGAGTGGQP